MKRKSHAISRRVRIRGHYWRVIIGGRMPHNHCEGCCRNSERTIWIRRSGEVFDTAVHEVLHACFPDLEEAAVEECEAAIVTVLRAIQPVIQP